MHSCWHCGTAGPLKSAPLPGGMMSVALCEACHPKAPALTKNDAFTGAPTT